MRVLARMVYTLAGLAPGRPGGRPGRDARRGGAPWSPAQQRATKASREDVGRAGRRRTGRASAPTASGPG